jgi:hypothetical protein
MDHSRRSLEIEALRRHLGYDQMQGSQGRAYRLTKPFQHGSPCRRRGTDTGTFTSAPCYSEVPQLVTEITDCVPAGGKYESREFVRQNAAKPLEFAVCILRGRLGCPDQSLQSGQIAELHFGLCFDRRE